MTQKGGNCSRSSTFRLFELFVTRHLSVFFSFLFLFLFFFFLFFVLLLFSHKKFADPA